MASGKPKFPLEDMKLLGCHKIIMDRLKLANDERLAKANVTDMLWVRMNDQAASIVFE